MKSIQLTTEPLEHLIQQGESIDFRLDEPAWENLKVGDTIEFWEDFSGWDKTPAPNARKVHVQIQEILKARTFNELIDSIPDTFVGRSNKEEILNDLRQWWTSEREKETGVIGWKVQVISTPAQWLNRMREIWLAQQLDQIAELLSPSELAYHEDPAEPPLTSIPAVVDAWQEIKQQQIEFVEIEILHEHQNVAMALWRFKQVGQPEHVGSYYLELDNRGKCKHFRQWWNSKEE
jgi:ASC-1-like (ASCH) protein